ncbi:MAG: hypothetical protein R3C61_24720 [Bacteroidia bacterium]
MKQNILLLSFLLTVSAALAEGFPSVVIHILQPENERFPQNGFFAPATTRGMTKGPESPQNLVAREFLDFSFHTRQTVELIILTPEKKIAGVRILTENAIPEIHQVPVSRWESGEYVFIFRGEGYFASYRVQVKSPIPQYTISGKN